MQVNKSFIVIAIVCGMALLYSRCINSSMPVIRDERGIGYAGAAACMQCHKDLHTEYAHTGHAQTSYPVTSPQGNIFPDRDSFVFDNETTVFIEKRDSGTYQVAYNKKEEYISKRFDMGFGSGAHAQTFGYWQDKQLYQLPLSYFTAIEGWANSPGFPAGQAYFNRPIVRRCFECHSSFVGEDAGNMQSLTQSIKLNQSSIIYGIDCERCHGPAAAHVVFHSKNPDAKEGKHITNWGSLTRQQKLDVCGICHSGNELTTQKSTFSFVPGDTLSSYYFPEFSAARSGSPDVHGNQSQLLAASLCFSESKNMECSSCHNVHEPKAQSIGDYSKQCLSCHKQPEHKSLQVQAYLGSSAVNNCIDCHMPEEASRLISFQVTGKQKAESYLLRTHRIAVYPQETHKFLLKAKDEE